MHYTAAVPLFSSSILLFGGLAAAVPVANADEPCQPRIICVDAINSCGIKYGGCYNVCDASAKPVPPPCPSTTKKPVPTSTKKTTTAKPTKPPVTSTKKPTTSTTKRPSPSTSSSCSATVSVCWDGINECGMMYGGCFPDCKPWPTFTPPPCPTSTSTASVTTLPVLTVPNHG